MKNQQNQLIQQIKEAQNLRADLDSCRIRLLESIPPDIQCDLHTHTLLDTLDWDLNKQTKNAFPNLLANGLTMSNHNDENLDKNSDLSLRDRVSKQFNEFLQWLIITQVRIYHFLITK